MNKNAKYRRILRNIERESNEDLILFALGFYNSLKREEFINDNDKLRRINKNTFHKYVKELIRNNWVNRRKEGKLSIYYITPLGRQELSRRLKFYDLDFESILLLENKKIQDSINSITKFFQKYYITNVELKIEFMDLIKEIPHEKLSNIFIEIKFYKLLLFLVLNHPRFYPEYTISVENFRNKYNIERLDSIEEILTEADISIFIQKIIIENFYNIKFFKIELENTQENLFFRKNSEYGRIVETTIESNYRKLYYLKNLEDFFLNDSKLNEVDENILTILIDKYKLFHPDLKNSLPSLLDDYRKLVKEEQIKNLTYLTNLNRYYSMCIINAPKQIIEEVGMKIIEEFHKTSKNTTKILMNSETSKEPKMKDEYLEKISTLWRNNEFKEALVLIEEAIMQNSKKPNYYSWKTNVLMEIDNIISLEPSQDLIDIISSNPLNEALKSIEKFFKLCEKYDENILYYATYKAEILYRMKKYEESLEALKLADQEQFVTYYDDFEDEDIYLHTIQGWYMDYNIYYIRAKIYYQLERYKDALDFIDKDLKYADETELGNSFAFKSEILTKLDRFKEALLAIEKAIEIEPSKIKLYYKKFNILLSTKNFDEIFKLIKNFSMKSQEYKELNDYSVKTGFYDLLIMELLRFEYHEIAEKLINELELLDDLDDDGIFIHDSWSNFFNPIIEYINKNQYNKALELIEVIEKNQPHYNRVADLRIIALAGLKNYDDALELVNIAINQKIDLMIKNPLISISFDDEKQEESKENIERLKIEQTYDLYLLKVKILRDMDNIEGSNNILDKMIYYIPNKDEAYIYKAVNLVILGRYNDSLEVIQKLIELKPKKLDFRLIEIEILELSGNYTDALEKVNKLIITNSGNINLLNYKVQLNGKLKNLENFEESAKNLLKVITDSGVRDSIQFECELCGSIFEISKFEKSWPKNCINKNCKASSINFKLFTKPIISGYWQIKFRELKD